MIASSFVFTGLIILVFWWDWITNLHSRTIWWVIISLMIIISYNWWYWTMHTITKLIEYQRDEYVLVQELLLTIRKLTEKIYSLDDRKKGP